MDALCFGFKSFGQLSNSKVSSALSMLKSHGMYKYIKFVTFSWSKCYIIADDGSVFVQGLVDAESNRTEKLILPFGNPVKKVTCLRKYDLFLTEDGFCWKYSKDKQWTKILNCCFEEPNEKEKNSVLIDINSSDELHAALSRTGVAFSLPLRIDIPAIHKVVKVCCGLEHYICLADTHSVFVWGLGSRGQLGNGSLSPVEQPELLVALDGLKVTDIDAGGWHSAAVTGSGDLYTWGWNNFGQLGFLTDTDTDKNRSLPVVAVSSEPKPVTWPENFEVFVEQISCGTRHTLVLLEDRTVWGCGCNKYGQINPSSDKKYFDQMVPVPVPETVEKVQKLSCSSWNSVLYVSYKS